MGILTNKQILATFYYSTFLYIFILIIIQFFDLQQMNSPYTEIITLFFLILLFSIPIYLFLILRVWFSKDYKVPDGMSKDGLLLFVVGNYLMLVFLKLYFKNRISFFNGFELINILYLLITVFILIYDYWLDYKNDKEETMLKLKIYFILTAISGPLIVDFLLIFSLSFLFQNINFDRLFPIIIILMVFLLILILSYKFLEKKYSIIYVIIFRHSENEKTQEYVKYLYDNPEKLKEYMNKTMLNISLAINLLDGLIIIPLTIYILVIL